MGDRGGRGGLAGGPARAVSDAAVPGTAGGEGQGAIPGEWTPTSWKAREALQQPTYPDPAELEAALADIAKSPPLVFAGECRQLQARLAAAARGEAFILQGGDCAERCGNPPLPPAAAARLPLLAGSSPSPPTLPLFPSPQQYNSQQPSAAVPQNVPLSPINSCMNLVPFENKNSCWVVPSETKQKLLKMT